jgi:Cysteine-rich CPXCG
MDDQFLVTCPYCGESIEIYLEADVGGRLIQDCEVCCNPWQVRVFGDGDERWVDVTKADGSE